MISVFAASEDLYSQERLRVGSKTFTESYILGEILAQVIEREKSAWRVDRRLGMGGSGIVFEAVRTGHLDFYPEYTGTLAEALLQRPELKSIPELREALTELGMTISDPLGFNNTYALAMRRAHAEELGVRNISDLVNHPNLRVGVSYEFLDRSDGFYALTEAYSLAMSRVRGMEHSLAYDALDSGSIDLMDVYTTDAKLGALDLLLLEDDLEFFPRYDAVILANLESTERAPEAWELLKTLEGQFSESKMIELNAMVDIDRMTIEDAARVHFGESIEISGFSRPIFVQELWLRTKEHVFLVVISLIFSILIAVPLGFLAHHSKLLEQLILSTTGIFQTIPSLALLGFLIPILGIGVLPALVAMILYALLPIVRNTYLGVEQIPKSLRETAFVLGLEGRRRLFWIELPLASPSILAGIKTSAVISVGTATLAAFIGAGGYGDFILRGLAINDAWTILHGALPAALMALLVQGIFDFSERWALPKGLRLSLQKSV
ncbi:MAG: ABC transporter permease subunit [Bradymonadales bacterium]|nr:MAG: ABC transporter permease subunit [Bradymonadales bacterium]